MSGDGDSSAATILQQTTSSAMKVFQARACSIAILEDNELVYVHASGDGADQIVGTRLPMSRGLAGYAMSGGAPVASFDVQADPRFAQDVADSTGYMPRALIAAPVQTERGSYGVLTVLDPAVTGAVGERLLELVTLLAHQAALSVEADGDKRERDAGDLRAEAIGIIQQLPDAQVAAATTMLRDLTR